MLKLWVATNRICGGNMIQYKREALAMATKLENKYKAEWRKMSKGEKQGYHNNFINFLNKRRMEDDISTNQS